ncbi:MAG TPA: hypothetical protein VFE22_03715, partial [Edaphobacter sp.]|nr:hypothetical protein [Edaphobacter sp.]
MQILFLISIVSFFVLLWASVAVVRRIRASHRIESPPTPPQPTFSKYLFSAAQDTVVSQAGSRRHQASSDTAS